MTDAEETTPETPDGEGMLQGIADKLQEFINAIHDNPPVLLCGAVVTWESMRFTEDGDPLYSVNYAALPNTSASSTIGILDLATEVAKSDMFTDHEED